MTIWFIWGYKDGDTWGLVERIAVQSAAVHNPDWAVVLVARRMPSGPHWEALRAAVPRLAVIPAPEVDTFRGRPIPAYQHRADFVRHSLLYSQGGAYLDLDTITLAPFPAWWLEQPYVVGLEYHPDGRSIGLCNAAFVCRAFSDFGWRILSEYQHFDPAVHRYEEFAVNRPLAWAADMPGAVTVLQWSLLGPMHWASRVYWEEDLPLDGVVVARALVRLEEVLCHEVLAELRGLTGTTGDQTPF